MKVRWTFHGSAMVADYDATLAPLVTHFGVRVLHDNVIEDEGIGRRGGMTWIGDGSLEIGEPAGERSPLHEFLRRFGGGMHSVALQVDDAARAREHFAAVGVRVVDEPLPGVLFTHPSDTAGILLEWSAIPQDDDPRWGAPLPPAPASTVDVTHIAFLTAAVRDPVGDAARLAEVLATDVTFTGDAGGGLSAGVSLADGTLALLDLDGAGTDRPRAHGIGLRVPDLDEALAALDARGCPMTRVGARLALAGPPVLPVPIYVTDALLPGDPRS
jgi:catechol 2,3-dioxygenase-like lactoylglutathione lyase family enzyme